MRKSVCVGRPDWPGCGRSFVSKGAAKWCAECLHEYRLYYQRRYYHEHKASILPRAREYMRRRRGMDAKKCRSRPGLAARRTTVSASAIMHMPTGKAIRVIERILRGELALAKSW